MKLENRHAIHYIKYMGSKTKILDFVLDGISNVHTTGALCDLFAGSCSLSGALGNQLPMVSNDIQHYSAVLARTYLTDWNDGAFDIRAVIAAAQEFHQRHYGEIAAECQYGEGMTLDSFNEIEHRSQDYIKNDFNNDWHLFTKNYSGTWWSLEQCTWIDSLRMAIETIAHDSPLYNTLLSSLMYAMAYCSQGTGHYAQYRDANTLSSMNDILIYRQKDLESLFERKALDAISSQRTKPNPLGHRVLAEDYRECLKGVRGSTIYADPPYCFVHYSRFYHALETLVLYDYPTLQEKKGEVVKGRYRSDRHQSPFCIRTQVEGAFKELFALTAQNGNALVLSYSDTGMIPFERLLELARNEFGDTRVSSLSLDYNHMTMGRRKDRSREVKEKLLLVRH